MKKLCRAVAVRRLGRGVIGRGCGDTSTRKLKAADELFFALANNSASCCTAIASKCKAENGCVLFVCASTMPEAKRCFVLSMCFFDLLWLEVSLVKNVGLALTCSCLRLLCRQFGCHSLQRCSFFFFDVIIIVK